MSLKDGNEIELRLEEDNGTEKLRNDVNNA